MRAIAAIVGLTAASLAACGGSTPPTESPASEGATSASTAATGDAAASAEPSAPPRADAAAKKKPLPTACATNEGGFCTPPHAFMKKICGGEFPTATLVLFSKNAPFTHAYLTMKVKGWSASGGGASGEELPQGEEVLVLERRVTGDSGGMQVSGPQGSYEVLRWDGSCVTLHEGELTTDAPARPKNARIVWNAIEMDMRDALRADAGVEAAFVKHRKECKGVSMGDVSTKCVDADKAINDAIVKYVRDGGKLVEPNKLP
jgi:hypothetical protein